MREEVRRERREARGVRDLEDDGARARAPRRRQGRGCFAAVLAIARGLDVDRARHGPVPALILRARNEPSGLLALGRSERRLEDARISTARAFDPRDAPPAIDELDRAQRMSA